MSSSAAKVRRDTAFGFLDSREPSERIFHPQLITNVGGNTMLKAIRDELRRCDGFLFSVAFVTPSAIALLKQALIDFAGRGNIVTSTYLGFNSPAAFRELLNLDNVDTFVYPSTESGFHPKGYIFHQDASETAIIGSSNLTQFALLQNHEWNLRFSALPEGDIVDQLGRAVQAQRAAAQPLTSAWVDDYAQAYVPPTAPNSSLAPDDTLPQGTVRPNAMQREALAEIQKVRDRGETRAVVVSATGTGKTILAALDVRAVQPKRLLFIVHREQIIDRAMEEFVRVLNAPPSDFGKFSGTTRQIDRRYVFATVQSLSRPRTLEAIAPDGFDYVIVDEVHRAGADTYRTILARLQPRFLLGMTATPERTDGFNVFELFDYNVPYEIRLQKALESNMLAPFHYYGVADFVTADGAVIDDATVLARLVAPERIDHLLRAIRTYGQAGVPVRGLIFCSRQQEARQLSALLNDRDLRGRRLRTRALLGDVSIDERERVVGMLERGELDYIITVDVFNEGIDIPSINQVVMLRETKSSIVFTQQLGRGLRKAAGKDHLVVIDFIGNYANNYLIPIALFGNSTLSKDSLRKDIIEAQDAGAIAGLSSVNFDAIARERIFRSIANTKLDSMTNLKRAYLDLEARLGKPPRLYDFARFDTVDPTVIATKYRTYWNFLARLHRVDEWPTPEAAAILTFLSQELLNGKRPHELLLLERLIDHGATGRAEYAALLDQRGCQADVETISCVERIFSLEFFTEAESSRYQPAVAVDQDGGFHLSDSFARCWASDATFRAQVRDLVETGLYLARHKYNWFGGLQIGQRYSRKDVCRLLNWKSNQQGTMFGYKVDFYSKTCPIFVTYHKSDEVTASTKYEDAFVSPSRLRWYTRSKRTLRSREVRQITDNRMPLHLFAKKDDAEGTDFYYLGPATSLDPRQEQMPGDAGKPLDVVSMTLTLASPVERGLYDYLLEQVLG